MSKDEEKLHVLQQRLDKLEVILTDFQISHEIHQAMITCLLLAQPEPEKIDAIWRKLGGTLGIDILERYSSYFSEHPHMEHLINKFTGSSVTFWKSILDQCIEIRRHSSSNDSNPSVAD